MALTEQGFRSYFPSLKQDQVFLDNAGGSQVLGTVIDSIRDYFYTVNVQLDASYSVGLLTTAKYDEAHAAAAKYINAGTDEVVFGSSTTQLFRNLSFAMKFKPGDEIIVSMIDHEANISPWVDLADRLGLVMKWWKPSHKTSPKLLTSDLIGLLTPKTKLVTFTHASNILGTVTDVKSIAEAAHKVGALVCVDGVALAAHRPIDVQALQADFYCFSWYKCYGPHISMLYASRTAQHHLRSLGHFFNPHVSLTNKLGLAGASYELLQAIPLVIDYLGTPDSDRWAAIIDQEKVLQEVLLAFLRSRSEVTVYGDVDGTSDDRLPTISFTVQNWRSEDFVNAVQARSNYGFRYGSNYADRLVREILGRGPDGVVRISMLHYNTVGEIEGLIEVIEKVLTPIKVQSSTKVNGFHSNGHK